MLRHVSEFDVKHNHSYCKINVCIGQRALTNCKSLHHSRLMKMLWPKLKQNDYDISWILGFKQLSTMRLFRSYYFADLRYLGCFEYDSTQLNLPEPLPGQYNSSSECIDDCLKLGYAYASMQNGTRCSCGYSYTDSGEEHYMKCPFQCRSRRWQSCGGQVQHAIYSTNIGKHYTWLWLDITCLRSPAIFISGR